MVSNRWTIQIPDNQMLTVIVTPLTDVTIHITMEEHQIEDENVVHSGGHWRTVRYGQYEKSNKHMETEARRSAHKSQRQERIQYMESCSQRSLKAICNMCVKDKKYGKV